MNFTRAAESLFVSQPALSQQIKQLEEQVGTQLLERSGRNVNLTDAGKIYVRHVKRALAEITTAGEALDDLSNLTRGSLTIGLTPITDYLTASLIRQFLDCYPKISLNTVEMTQQQIEESVLQDNVNIGVIFSDSFSLTTRSKELEAYTLKTDSLVLASRLDKKDVQVDKDLSPATETLTQPLALLNSKFEIRKQIDNYFSENSLDPLVSLESNSVGFIIEIVRRGGFMTILPESIVASIEDLSSIPIKPSLPKHTATIIMRRSAHRSQACTAFLELALSWH